MNRRTMLSYFRTRDKGGAYTVQKRKKNSAMNKFWYKASYYYIESKHFVTFSKCGISPNVTDHVKQKILSVSGIPAHRNLTM